MIRTEGGDGLGIYDLEQNPQFALARVVRSIEKMESLKRDTLDGTPEMRRINGVLRGLRRNEARLSAGIKNQSARAG